MRFFKKDSSGWGSFQPIQCHLKYFLDRAWVHRVYQIRHIISSSRVAPQCQRYNSSAGIKSSSQRALTNPHTNKMSRMVCQANFSLQYDPIHPTKFQSRALRGLCAMSTYKYKRHIRAICYCFTCIPHHSGPWGDMVIQNPLAILSSRKLNFLNAWQIPLTVYYDASAEPHSTILWIHHLYFTSYLYKQKFWNAWKFPLLYYDASACTQQSPNSWPHRSATAVDFVSNSRILPSSKTQE